MVVCNIDIVFSHPDNVYQLTHLLQRWLKQTSKFVTRHPRYQLGMELQ